VDVQEQYRRAKAAADSCIETYGKHDWVQSYEHGQLECRHCYATADPGYRCEQDHVKGVKCWLCGWEAPPPEVEIFEGVRLIEVEES